MFVPTVMLYFAFWCPNVNENSFSAATRRAASYRLPLEEGLIYDV
jgi:hypothetical protein